MIFMGYIAYFSIKLYHSRVVGTPLYHFDNHIIDFFTEKRQNQSINYHKIRTLSLLLAGKVVFAEVVIKYVIKIY